MTTDSGSFESVKMMPEQCPSMSLGSEEESFVVLWKDTDTKSMKTENNAKSVSNVTKKSISKELKEIEENVTNNIPQTEEVSDTSVKQETVDAEMDISTLPTMPEVENGFDSSGVISITTLPNDLTPEQIEKKLGEIVEENVQLKNTILHNNRIMKSQYERIVQWQSTIEKAHQAHKMKIIEAKEFIEKLKRENYNVTRDLKQASASKKTLEEEVNSLKRMLDIANNRVIELESVVKENSTQKLTNGTNEEHEKVVNKLQVALESKIAETEEAKMEMVKTNCLHEEKLKSLNDVIDNLRFELFVTQQEATAPAKVTKLVTDIENLKKEVVGLKGELETARHQKDEIYALKAQLALYKSDFEAEKNVSEVLKVEKDKCVNDMQKLKTRNEEMEKKSKELYDRYYFVPKDQMRVPPPRASEDNCFIQ